jgi:hypothetical protein
MTGVLIGSLLIGPIGDMYGRKVGASVRQLNDSLNSAARLRSRVSISDPIRHGQCVRE